MPIIDIDCYNFPVEEAEQRTQIYTTRKSHIGRGDIRFFAYECLLAFRLYRRFVLVRLALLIGCEHPIGVLIEEIHWRPTACES